MSKFKVISGAEIMRIRRKLDMSQADLAGALQMGTDSRKTVNRWETEKYFAPGPAAYAIKAMEVLHDLGQDPTDLFDFED